MPKPAERLFDHHAFSSPHHIGACVWWSHLTIICGVCCVRWAGSHARRKAHSISIQRLRVISPLVTCYYLMIAIKTEEEKEWNGFRFGILCGARILQLKRFGSLIFMFSQMCVGERANQLRPTPPAIVRSCGNRTIPICKLFWISTAKFWFDLI